MKSPLISVIVPVYNKEHYVAKLISCVKDQTFRDFECIIVDDGSTDKSGQICDEMTLDDENIVVHHIQNGGVSHARNTALDIAKGEYITFLDSDDEIPNDYLQKIAEDIKQYNADMIIGAIKMVSDSGERIVDYPFDQRVYSMQELLPQFAEAQRDCGVFGWCVNKTFRRELANSCRFDEKLTLYEDFDFYLWLYPKIDTVYFDVYNYYLYYSDRSNFSTFDDSKIDYQSQLIVQLRLKQFLENNNTWSGCNKDIVSKRIQDYLFFIVFHSPKECFKERFIDSHDYYNQSGIIIKERNTFKGLILNCIKLNNYCIVKVIITLYKTFTKIIHR